MGYPMVDLSRFPVDLQAARKLSQRAMLEHNVLPLIESGDRLIVAVDDLARIPRLQSLQTLARTETGAGAGRARTHQGGAGQRLPQRLGTDCWADNVPLHLQVRRDASRASCAATDLAAIQAALRAIEGRARALGSDEMPLLPGSCHVRSLIPAFVGGAAGGAGRAVRQARLALADAALRRLHRGGGRTPVGVACEIEGLTSAAIAAQLLEIDFDAARIRAAHRTSPAPR